VFLNDCMSNRIYPGSNKYNHSNPQRFKNDVNTTQKNIEPFKPLYIGPNVGGSFESLGYYYFVGSCPMMSEITFHMPFSLLIIINELPVPSNGLPLSIPPVV
jgi:hypothetical protein